MTSPDSALIVQHSETAPPAMLAEWAAARDIAVELHLARADESLPDPAGRPFVASLGSKYSPRARAVPQVREALKFTERALEADVPVLGLCYGAQLLAEVLGGTVEPSPEPELGWYRVDSADPDFVPEGPWLQWHYDCFTLPPGAELLATSPNCVQAFAYRRSLAVQFHPESTIEIVSSWARKDHERLVSLGVKDARARLERGRSLADGAVTSAFSLFDAFLQRGIR